MFAYYYDHQALVNLSTHLLASNTSGAPVTAHTSAGSSIIYIHTLDFMVDPWNYMKLLALAAFEVSVWYILVVTFNGVMAKFGAPCSMRKRAAGSHVLVDRVFGYRLAL